MTDRRTFLEGIKEKFESPKLLNFLQVEVKIVNTSQKYMIRKVIDQTFKPENKKLYFKKSKN